VCELAVVVELAVLHDDDGAVLVGDRLLAVREVDDRKTTRGKADAVVDVRALRIGAAVDERLRHPAQPLAIHGATGGRDSADPTHGDGV
jgi:hypothetical protein